MDDPDDGLLGIFLKALYPEEMPLARALTHLRSPRLEMFSDQFLVFWTRHVPAEATHAQRAELLDAIAADFGSFRSVMTGKSNHHAIMGHLPAELLKFRLRSLMDDIPIERLWGWLLVASEPDLRVLDPAVGAVGVGLERNEDKLKELINYGVERYESAEDTVSCMRSVQRALFRARPPDFGQWCAYRALSATAELAAAIYIRAMWIT